MRTPRKAAKTQENKDEHAWKDDEVDNIKMTNSKRKGFDGKD